MNIIRNRTMHPDLREDEVLVIENAIRIAIDSIINVLYSVNSSKTHEYQRMVADRDKEIQRLECRSKEIEHELQLIRQDGCSRGLFGEEVRHVDAAAVHSDTHEEMGEIQITFDTEMTRGQDSEMNISCLFARTPSQISSSQTHDLAFSSSPNNLSIDQIAVSNSVVAPVVPEGPSNLSISTSSLIVKEEPLWEEPCDIDTVLIKWEMSEHNTANHQETVGGDLHQNDKIPRIKRRLENRERIKKFRDKLYANPEKHRVYKEMERLRNGKRSVPMSELPEETQRQKRAAWRAASRRYYARKVACQQTRPSPSSFIPQYTPCSLPLPELLGSGGTSREPGALASPRQPADGPPSRVSTSQPPSRVSTSQPPYGSIHPGWGKFYIGPGENYTGGDKRRRTLISELPEDTQTMQREAWRAASRRYYAKKMGRLQADPTQLNHLDFHNTDTTARLQADPTHLNHLDFHNTDTTAQHQAHPTHLNHHLHNTDTTAHLQAHPNHHLHNTDTTAQHQAHPNHLLHNTDTTARLQADPTQLTYLLPNTDKTARLQAHPTQLNHLLHNTDTTEGTSGQNNSGLGGIVCS